MCATFTAKNSDEALPTAAMQERDAKVKAMLHWLRQDPPLHAES